MIIDVYVTYDIYHVTYILYHTYTIQVISQCAPRLWYICMNVYVYIYIYSRQTHTHTHVPFKVFRRNSSRQTHTHTHTQEYLSRSWEEILRDSPRRLGEVLAAVTCSGSPSDVSSWFTPLHREREREREWRERRERERESVSVTVYCLH